MYVYRRRLYTAVQAALDAVSLGLAWEASAQLRILLNPIMKQQLTLRDSTDWVPSLAAILLLWMATSWKLRLYRPPHELQAWSALIWAGKNALAISSITMLSVFFSRQMGEGASRMFVVCMLPVTCLVFAATRWIAMSALAAAHGSLRAPRIALIGDPVSANRLANQLIDRLEFRMAGAVHGVIVPEAAAAMAVGHFAPVSGATAQVMEAGRQPGLPVLGTTRQIAELVNREQIERVIVLNGSLSEAEVERCNKIFWRMGLPVNRSLDLAPLPERVGAGRPTHRVALSKQDGLSIVEVRPARFPLTKDYLKYALDFGLAGILLALLWPVLLAAGILIKLTSQGPVMDSLTRVGKGGRHFGCLKFRTTFREGDPALLRTRTEGPGEFDQRDTLTPAGRFLRRYTLDELPQLINILRGEMSFVGPRPLPSQDFGPDGMSRQFWDWSVTRSGVRPGLTGLWQISGRRNLSFDEMIRLDIEYIQTRSFLGDIGILLRTPAPVLRGVGAR